jgi:hypothetical protein
MITASMYAALMAVAANLTPKEAEEFERRIAHEGPMTSSAVFMGIVENIKAQRTPDLVGICPNYCDRPWDQHEGRWCEDCYDFVPTCANDHCSVCGRST